MFRKFLPRKRWQMTYHDPHLPHTPPIVIGEFWTQYAARSAQVNNLRRFPACVQVRVRKVYGP